MELSYVLLAKKADFGSDGLLSVIGADISVLGAEQFPYTPDSLALVARMGFPGSETEKEHRFKVEVYAPDGSTVEETDLSFRVGPVQPPSKLSYFGVLANFEGIVLATPGAYTFSVKVDSKEVRKVVLQIVSVAPPQVS